MAALVTTQGPTPGLRFEVHAGGALIGRQPDADVYLESLAVSRQHARLVRRGGAWFVEDMGSSNGTYLNGNRILGPTPLTECDELQIGPYVLNLHPDPAPGDEPEQIIRAQVNANSANQTLYSQNPSYKLQVVLEISRHLGRTLETDALLGRLLEHLLRLFPQADRGLVVLCDPPEGASGGPAGRLVVRAQRTRQQGETDFPYSRTLVRRALEEGAGLLSEDVGDGTLKLSDTLASLNLRSFLCVPLLGSDGRRLGVIQLDCLRPGLVFLGEDLELLTAIALHAAVVLENAELHAERLREEGFRQELRLARRIQQSFLPTDFASVQGEGLELFARVHPAHEVSGDLYDFFPLPDGRLAFFVGDVSGKGMPAALFMIAVHTLSRHLTPASAGPAELLRRLNQALVADNPTALFVTLAHGVYDRRDGSLVLASGGHPAPLLRRADGRVEEVALRPGVMLGCSALDLVVSDTRLLLAPGETLALYTDGFTEAFAPDRDMFGRQRLCEVLGGERMALPLEACAAEASAAVQRFTGQAELQDDQTLLLLRRPVG